MITCVHCEAPFSLQPEGVAIVGLSDAEKLTRLLVHLTGHMQMRHPEQFNISLLMGDRLMCVGMLAHFDLRQEDQLLKWRTEAAATVHQLVRRQLPDDHIRQAVDRFAKEKGAPPDGPLVISRAGIAELIRQMRDWLDYDDVLNKKEQQTK